MRKRRANAGDSIRFVGVSMVSREFGFKNRLRWRQRRLARELAVEFLDEFPKATDSEVRDHVAAEMNDTYGMAIDPMMIMGFIKLILELIRLWQDRRDNE